MLHHMFTILILVIGVSYQYDFQSNIILEQDPRQQDPFYRRYSSRASGVPVLAVNSVVHNVKHQSSGRLQIWDDLPSHKVRPGYTTTTPPPPPPPTTPPWVRGRPRPNHGHPPWQQSDLEGHDYEEVEDTPPPPPRPRGRRPANRRAHRKPPPDAPARLNIPKPICGEGDEGTMEDSECQKMKEKENQTEEGTRKEEKNVRKSTKKKRKSQENEEYDDYEDVEGPSEGMKKMEKVEENPKEGEVNLEDASVHNIRKTPKTETRAEGDEEGKRVKSNSKSRKSEKKKNGSGEEDDGKDHKEGNEEDSDDDDDKKKKKKKKNKGKGGKNDEDGSDDEEDKNGELKEVNGNIKVPKTVDGDTRNEDDSDDHDNDDGDKKTKKKKKKKRGKDEDDSGDEDSEEESEEDEEEEDDDDDEEEEEEESRSHDKKKSKKKSMCRKGGQQSQQHQNTVQPVVTNPNTNPTGSYGIANPQHQAYNTPLPPMTTPSNPVDDYNGFEDMECKDMNDNYKDDDNEDEEEEEEDKKKKKKKKKKKGKKSKKDKKRKKKKGKKGSSQRDFLTSFEKNNRQGTGILDEVHATVDSKQIEKTSARESSGINCATATDEFPLKCGAWQTAGFCDTNQATQFLWCRKTCHCSSIITTRIE